MKRGNSIWLQYHNCACGWDEYPKGSMISFLRETADKYPDHVAIEFEEKKTRFCKLIRKIERVATALYAQGIRKGDYVTIISPNIPQALISVYALNQIGAIANILHPLLSTNEIERFTKAVNSKAIIILDMIYPKIKNIEYHGTIILMNVADELPFYKRPFYSLKNKGRKSYNPNHTVVTWKKIITGNHGCTPQDNGIGDDVAVILYSGGTSGNPKAVEITNSNLNCLAVQSHDVYERDDIAGTHSLALMPIFHGFGLGVCMHGMLCNALHIFMIPKYDMQLTTKLIFKRKISFLFGVPALYEALSRSVEIEKKDLSFIQFIVVAGDKVTAKLTNRFDRQLKNGGSSAFMREAYGQTECTSGCCINPFFAPKPGSMGIPYTDMLMKIVEPGTEIELNDGISGEICISGPTVMKGYLDNPEETKKTLKRHADGRIWLHTGDSGHKDTDGYYYYDQRLSRMIITSGYNVYPAEVEEAILQSRIVKECCVVGKSDPVVGQTIRAFVVLNDPSGDQERAKGCIMDACSKSIAEYAFPNEILFVEKLPKTSLNKVDYKKLEEVA